MKLLIVICTLIASCALPLSSAPPAHTSKELNYTIVVLGHHVKVTYASKATRITIDGKEEDYIAAVAKNPYLQVTFDARHLDTSFATDDPDTLGVTAMPLSTKEPKPTKKTVIRKVGQYKVYINQGELDTTYDHECHIKGKKYVYVIDQGTEDKEVSKRLKEAILTFREH